MDFKLSEEDAQLVEMIDRVAMEQFRPTAFDDRDTPRRPVENMRILGDLGILGICLPEEVGGAGRTAISGILAIERIAHACPRTGAAALMAISGPGMFIARWGNAEQKARYLPPVLRGEAGWWISLTEPQAGTALTDLTTRATIDGSVCRINGQKTFCSNAALNDHILLFCRFGPGTAGIGAVILDRNTLRANDDETSTPREFRPAGAEGSSRSCPCFTHRSMPRRVVPRTEAGGRRLWRHPPRHLPNYRTAPAGGPSPPGTSCASSPLPTVPLRPAGSVRSCAARASTHQPFAIGAVNATQEPPER